MLILAHSVHLARFSGSRLWFLLHVEILFFQSRLGKPTLISKWKPEAFFFGLNMLYTIEQQRVFIMCLVFALIFFFVIL